MSWIRKNLDPLDIARIREYQYMMTRRYKGRGPNASFWDELGHLVKRNPKRYDWEKMEGGIVKGEVWSQQIGDLPRIRIVVYNPI